MIMMKNIKAKITTTTSTTSSSTGSDLPLSISIQKGKNDDELVLEDSDDEYVDQFLESQWQDGVEIGLIVNWPTIEPLQLSTRLSESSMVPLFDGTGWAGTRVWKAALLAVKYMEQEYLSSSSSNRPLSLLELGCGLGVPGMLWHRLQLKLFEEHKCSSPIDIDQDISSYKVVLTDQPSLVSLLQDNLQTNFPNDDRIQVQSLSWSQEGIQRLLMHQEKKDRVTDAKDATARASPSQPFLFDICLNCDCIYEPLYGRDSWMAMADILIELASLSPNTILLTSVERRNADGLDGFLDRLDQSPIIGSTRCVLRNDDDKHHVIEIYLTKSAAAIVSTQE
jgi:Lysine methyltransferase